MKVLVVNCGSSSIKYQLYEMPEKRVISKGLVERIGEEGSALQHHYADEIRRLEGQIADHEEGMALILETLTGPRRSARNRRGDRGRRPPRGARRGGVHRLGSDHARGHRFDRTLCRPGAAAQSAQPDGDPCGHARTARRAPGRLLRHGLSRHDSEVAYTYALPYQLYEKFGIRRYGFHGTSHRYVGAPRRRSAGDRQVRHQLHHRAPGNGCSMAAVEAGRSVDTSMGLTPLEGLVMEPEPAISTRPSSSTSRNGATT